MRKSIAIATGAVTATILTHGMVFSGMHLDKALPISTYQGAFQSLLLALERVWSHAHGWQSLSHIDEFAQFYALTVHVLCPVIGFAFFWMISRRKIGIQVWKPLAIVLLSATPLFVGNLAPVLKLGLGELGAQMAWTLLVVLAAVLSVETFRRVAAPATGTAVTA